MLPLRDVVLFPHVAMPLLIGRAGSLAAVSDATEGRTLGLLGEPRVNVLELNLALERHAKQAN